MYAIRSYYEKRIRQIFKGSKWLYIAGGILWFWIVGTAALITWAIIEISYDIHWLVGTAVELWLAFTVLATGCLKESAHEVLTPFRITSYNVCYTKLLRLALWNRGDSYNLINKHL